MINLDNKNTINNIRKIISELKTENIEFVNASDLTGYDLTIRGMDGV